MTSRGSSRPADEHPAGSEKEVGSAENSPSIGFVPATGEPASRRHRAAVAESYRQHFAAIESFARGVLRDADAAADVAQETFRKALEQTDSEQLQLAWYYRVAHNDCLSRIRRRKVAMRHWTLRLPEVRRCQEEADGLEADPVQAAVQKVFDRLSEDDRELLTARFLEQKSYREIAADLGTNVSTLTTRVSRLLDRIRQTTSSEMS